MRANSHNFDPVLRDLSRHLHNLEIDQLTEDAIDDRAAELEVETCNCPHEFSRFLLDLMEDQARTETLGTLLRDLVAAQNTRWATGDAEILRASRDVTKFLNKEIKRAAREEAEFELSDQH